MIFESAKPAEHFSVLGTLTGVYTGAAGGIATSHLQRPCFYPVTVCANENDGNDVMTPGAYAQLLFWGLWRLMGSELKTLVWPKHNDQH